MPMSGDARATKPIASPVLRPRRRFGHVIPVSVGLGLGLSCAIVPGYMFLDPATFGWVAKPEIHVHLAPQVVPATTVVPAPALQEPWDPIAVAHQPIAPQAAATRTEPRLAAGTGMRARLAESARVDPVGYRLVHISNGRAMIDDGNGLSIVERGSRLPDDNQVAAIEQREGQWVLVTSADEILSPAY